MNTTNVKPTVPEVLPLVNDYYVCNPTGGNLHIVLEDGNISDSDIEHCIVRCVQDRDWIGWWIGELLLKMSKTQRTKIYRKHK